MGRWSIVVSSALLLASGMNVFGQRTGAGYGARSVGGGSHQSIGSGFRGQSSTTFSTLSNSYPLPGQAVYPTPIGLQRQYSGYSGINNGVYPTNSGFNNNGGRRNSGGNGGYGYGYGYGLPYLPILYSSVDDYNSFGNQPWQGVSAEAAAQTAAVTSNLLGEQINRLTAEVEALRNERDVARSSPGDRAPYIAPSVRLENEPPAGAPVTLVLHGGKQLKVKSYAVMGNELWDFSSQHTRRIALSTVDIAASRTATEEAGGEFPTIR